MSYLLLGLLSWLFNSLHLIILFLAVQGADARVKVSTFSCIDHLEDVKNALQEAIAMADFAYQRQNGLSRQTLNPGNMRATMNTFATYFSRMPIRAGVIDPSAEATGYRLNGKGFFQKISSYFNKF